MQEFNTQSKAGEKPASLPQVVKSSLEEKICEKGKF